MAANSTDDVDHPDQPMPILIASVWSSQCTRSSPACDQRSALRRARALGRDGWHSIRGAAPDGRRTGGGSEGRKAGRARSHPPLADAARNNDAGELIPEEAKMPDATTATGPTTAEQAVVGWLDEFNAALVDQDAAAVADLFATESFWRDLVALTWNLKTVEGRDGIRDMLGHTLSTARPRDFRPVEPPSE